MRLLINLSRIAFLSACAMWLIMQTRNVHAALQNCPKYYTENGVGICNNCCTAHPTVNNWTDGTTTGAGIQTLEPTAVNCGSPTTSCSPGGTQSTVCANNSYDQAVDDPADCCFPSGMTCSTSSQCCNGLICRSSKTCGTCIGDGGTCSANSDCCSGDCSGGTCLTPAPCDGRCPAGECVGPANYSEYPATGCPPNARNSGGWCCNAETPIIIDVDGSGFDLTSLEDGVHFDISNVGTKALISWTAAQSTNAWLALDRNGNGKIDSGAELFGNATPQPDPPSGQWKNGFLALAVFDRPENGGNGDGFIDEKDAVYDRLLLWRDLNHDGISQSNELKHLRDFGISAISLSYQESRKEDQFGNLFRYRSRIYSAHRIPDDRWTYNVILLVAPEWDESSLAAASRQ